MDANRVMPTYTPINQYAATIDFNISPEYQDIKERIFENADGNLGDKNKLIGNVGISAAVKVRFLPAIILCP